MTTMIAEVEEVKKNHPCDKEYCFEQQSSFPQELYFLSFQVFKFGSFILIQAFHLVTYFISEPLLLIALHVETENFLLSI